MEQRVALVCDPVYYEGFQAVMVAYGWKVVSCLAEAELVVVSAVGNEWVAKVQTIRRFGCNSPIALFISGPTPKFIKQEMEMLGVFGLLPMTTPTRNICAYLEQVVRWKTCFDPNIEMVDVPKFHHLPEEQVLSLRRQCAVRDMVTQ